MEKDALETEGYGARGALQPCTPCVHTGYLTQSSQHQLLGTAVKQVKVKKHG